LSLSYWIDNLGFITEGKLAAIFIKTFSWGFPNGRSFYFINSAPSVPYKCTPATKHLSIIDNLLWITWITPMPHPSLHRVDLHWALGIRWTKLDGVE
jgi:hypothetical protein